MTKEALKLALEALQHEADKGNDDAYKVERDAIKEALAQPEQEPVTWRYKIVDVFGRPAWTLKTPKSDTRVLESQPLYTTPPQRTWVGLTLDEVLDMARTFGAQPWPPNSCAALGKMIEAKLKEKNHG